MTLPNLPVSIRELAGRKRVVLLADTDLPRDDGGWMALGGAARTAVKWYPGAQEPNVQHLGPEEGEITFSGLFDDHAAELPGHAFVLYETLDSMRQAGHAVEIGYGPILKRCSWVRADFRVRDVTRVYYQLRFQITRVGRGLIARILDRASEIPELAGASAAAQAAIDAIGELPPGVNQTIAAAAGAAASSALGGITVAEEVLGSIATQGQVVDPNKAKNSLESMDTARTDLAGAYDTLNLLGNGSLSGSVLERAEKATKLPTARESLLTAAGELRKARPPVALLAQETTEETVYTVGEGDTLRKLALRFYNSADRWNEILRANGLKSSFLEPGSRLIIPSAPAVL